jgi:transketolase
MELAVSPVEQPGADGVVLGLTRFGASAPYEKIYEHLGMTVQKIVAAAKSVARSGLLRHGWLPL